MQILLTPADTGLIELATRALDEPVVLQQNDQEIAVILSPEEYRRLTRAHWEDFDAFCLRISKIAQGNGLTEERLEEVLAEIDAETPR